MNRLFFPRFILLFIILITGTVTGCREEKPTAPVPKEIFKGVIDTSGERLKTGTRGGTIIRADIQELDNLNPVTTRSRSAYAVLKLVFEGLLSIHPITGQVQGGIAKEYRVINDGYSILLSLNTNVRFSDNVLCTADDVIFTFEEIFMNPDVDSKKIDALKIRNSLVSLEKIDDFTVRFDLPVPYRPFLYTLANIQILPKHILEPLIRTGGIEEFNEGWGSIDGSTGDVIGTGPYVIKELNPGQYLKLVRNPYYDRRDGGLWLEGMPYIDEIIELLDVDEETKFLKFQIGEIDFYDIKDLDIASGDLDVLLMNRSEGGYRIYSGGQTLKSNHFLAFNLNRNAVDDEKLSIFQTTTFRKAILHLIDRELILNEVYKGYGYIDDSPERNISPFYRSMESNSYNVEKGLNFLSRVPLEDTDGDGYLDLPSGKPLRITILTNEDNPFRVRMGQIISDNLQKAGLNATCEPISYDIIVTKLLDIFDWDAVILGVDAKIDPNDSSRIWESKGSLHVWFPYQHNPQTGWERRIDELFALGRTTWDFEKARGFYHEYQEIIAREVPLINIVIPAELYGYSTGYENIIPRSITYNALGLMPYIFTAEKN